MDAICTQQILLSPFQETIVSKFYTHEVIIQRWMRLRIEANHLWWNISWCSTMLLMWSSTKVILIVPTKNVHSVIGWPYNHITCWQHLKSWHWKTRRICLRTVSIPICSSTPTSIWPLCQPRKRVIQPPPYHLTTSYHHYLQHGNPIPHPNLLFYFSQTNLP